jgi:hypothetical protein
VSKGGLETKLHASSPNKHFVETGPYRRRGEKVPKTALEPLEGAVGGDLGPISGSSGPNLPTDLKHAPRAPTDHRSWTASLVSLIDVHLSIFVGPTARSERL